MNDILGIWAKIEKPKDLKNRPLLAKMLSEAKEWISAKEKFRVESMQNIRSMIDAENFAGKDKIEVTTSKEERDQLIIKTKDASFFVDFIYEQEGEVFDSLRKWVIHPPANITLSSKVEW